MHALDRLRDEFLDQDTAVRRALETTDRGLFDVDEDFLDDDLDALRPPVRRGSARLRSPT